MKKRLLFISKIFPSTLANKHATYNIQSLCGLKDVFDIDVINPIPWHMRITHRIATRYSLDGLDVYHPTYWYPPGVLRSHYGWFYYLSIKGCVARYIREKKPDIVYSSWLYPDGWAASRVADYLAVPSITKAIGTDANRLKKDTKLANKTVDTITRSKRTICVSEALKNKLVGIGADRKKLTVLYNGVNRDIFYKMDKESIRKELGYTIEDTLILFVGNLLKTKGLNELADAFQNISEKKQKLNVKLVVAGSGSYEAKFKQRLKTLGVLGNTIFMGSCPLAEVAKLMNATDIVCLPSYSEGRPNVVVEALCCNAKVVASDVGGTPELKELHNNLYLVPAKDSQGLTEALLTALAAECYQDNADDIDSWEEYAGKLARYLDQ